MTPQIVFFLVLSLLVYGGGSEPPYQPEIGNFSTSSSLICPDQIFVLKCDIIDLDDRSTIQNVTVELSLGEILFWRNKTDTFNLIRNPNNFLRLEPGSYSEIVNSSALTMNFCLSYRINATLGFVDVISSGTKVYDNSSSSCGYGNHTALFQIVSPPEGWQHNPSTIPQSGHILKIEEAVVILVVSLVIIAVLSLFASRRKKSTKEKYEALINVKPKRRNE